MIDQIGRRSLAKALTQLLDGTITTDDFDDMRPTSDDRGIVMIWRHVHCLYDSLWPHRLTQVSPEIKATIERCILFLNYSNFEYRWQDKPVVSMSLNADFFFILGWLVHGCAIVGIVFNCVLTSFFGLLICALLFIIGFFFQRRSLNLKQLIVSPDGFKVWPFFSIIEYESVVSYLHCTDG